MRKSIFRSFVFWSIFIIIYIIIENIFFNKYSIDTFVAINEILFCGCLSAYLCSYYLKIKYCFSKCLNKIKQRLLLLASFVLGSAFTYAFGGLFSLCVFAIIDALNPHSISSWNQEWNTAIPLFMGLFSSIIIVAFYIIIISEKIKSETKNSNF